MRLECQYNTDLFDDGHGRPLADSYETLLRAAVADGEQPRRRAAVVRPRRCAELAALEPAEALSTATCACTS